MTKILLVDDDPPMVSFLEHLFGDSGYQTLCAFDGLTALREFFTTRPDVAIIDLLMPHMDGFELCRRIREISHIPIIVLTGLEQIGEKVNAFNAGADDYLVKPVSGRELLARVEAFLRRVQWPQAAASTSLYTDPHLTVDFTRREVFVDGEIKELTPIEYALITLFVQRPGEALSLEYLLTNVWGREYETFDLVKWHISNLRKKLKAESDGGENEDSSFIVTVRGYGYRYKTSP
ncbi:MAG TPA: response regulator transcription factor [Dehalococcoidia bacterium]|nr:response regulator transcription factor [Dehalococcoidia bacterium]